MGRKAVNIMLGTAQFGMSYGIANKLGRTKEDKVSKILEYASEQGIDVLDTALSYGNSESVIGNYIRNYATNKHQEIVTKIANFEKQFN
jgi:aryl-alcohol dehydrogenase-like predicted oxidoreductase